MQLALKLKGLKLNLRAYAQLKALTLGLSTYHLRQMQLALGLQALS